MILDVFAYEVFFEPVLESLVGYLRFFEVQHHIVFCSLHMQFFRLGVFEDVGKREFQEAVALVPHLTSLEGRQRQIRVTVVLDEFALQED